MEQPHTSEDPNMRLLLMSGSISAWMKRDLAKNPVAFDDEARQQISEWFANYLDNQIKLAVRETRKSIKTESPFTPDEAVIVMKGVALFRAHYIMTHPQEVDGTLFSGTTLDMENTVTRLMQKISYL